MIKLLTTLCLMFFSITTFAEDYYVFQVNAKNDKLVSDYKTSSSNEVLFVSVENNKGKKESFYKIYVTEAQYNAGWDAFPQAMKDAGKDTAEDSSAESDNSSIDAQALIEVIAELTGAPVGQVKSKFKTAKKTKEKNK